MRYALERQRIEDALRRLTLVDDLTGLYNRRGFVTIAEQHLKLATRTRKGFYLIIADIDGMKKINDTFGHQEGDRALIRTARLLEKTFRTSDIKARLGGDEFTVLAIDADRASFEIICDRLQWNLREYNVTRDSPWTLSLSMGMAHYDPTLGSSLEELLAQADSALYEHKKKRG